ncbi:MAG: metallophosphoesterase [Ardenticatenaceae bacterium]|nr:metallophosphoesterase [Ardenticatenaceae bacterium]MCB9446117.1 metallophosphoesterase [Ardenticatenaceae bacterium]
MLFFHVPATWPIWAMVLVGAAFVFLATLPWWWLWGIPIALAVAGIHTLFLGDDAALFFTLPRKKISFGPWQSQAIVLAVPRTLATMGAVLLGWWLGWQWTIVLVVVLQLAGSVALFWGTAVEPLRPQLSEISIATDRLPVGTAPIRMLHISDLHVERLTQREETVLRLAERLKPDIILITGDYVNLSYNRDPVTHTQVRQLLSQIKAPYGVYATLGSPPVDLPEKVAPLFDNLAIRLMRFDWETVDLGDGRTLTLVGMDCTHHLPTDRAKLAELMTAVPNHAPQIFLYHSPELMPEASQYGLDLYLCGHTHGGQVRLPLIGPILTSSQLGRQYVMGLYRNGRTHLYVSRGIGLEGLSAPRVRFLAPPEMTLITLRARGES